jgi:two-component system cell cycle response regulator CpdR
MSPTFQWPIFYSPGTTIRCGNSLPIHSDARAILSRTSATGARPWELIRREQDFDLLLADIVMPCMDGIELAQRVSGEYPNLKIMLITGFAAVAVRAKEASGNKTKVLSKPFRLKDLIIEVETILAARAFKKWLRSVIIPGHNPRAGFDGGIFGRVAQR